MYLLRITLHGNHSIASIFRASTRLFQFLVRSHGMMLKKWDQLGYMDGELYSQGLCFGPMTKSLGVQALL